MPLFLKLITLIILPITLTSCAKAQGALAPTGDKYEGHGAKAPKLVSNDLVKKMKPGSVLVDVAIDQGGCFTDSKPTTHQEPTYKVHNSIFYCVANMPGAVPATSTYALANATIKYGLALANKGWEKALADDAHLAKGLNVHEGKIMYGAVAKAHNL